MPSSQVYAGRPPYVDPPAPVHIVSGSAVSSTTLRFSFRSFRVNLASPLESDFIFQSRLQNSKLLHLRIQPVGDKLCTQSACRKPHSRVARRTRIRSSTSPSRGLFSGLPTTESVCWECSTIRICDGSRYKQPRWEPGKTRSNGVIINFWTMNETMNYNLQL